MSVAQMIWKILENASSAACLSFFFVVCAQELSVMAGADAAFDNNWPAGLPAVKAGH